MSDNCEKSDNVDRIEERCKQCGDTRIRNVGHNYFDTCQRQVYRDGGLEDCGGEFEELSRSVWIGEDTEERSVEELKEQLQENARKIAEGETVTLEEALDKRTENPEELLDGDDIDVDASDVEISFPEGEDTPEEIADDEVVMRSISGKGATKKELEEAAERSEEKSEKSTEECDHDFKNPRLRSCPKCGASLTEVFGEG